MKTLDGRGLPRRAAHPLLGRAAWLVIAMSLLSPTLAMAAEDADGDGLRDAFERRWGVSDPDLSDSDGDGLIDPAEDGDDDRLSALGEQRFGSDPGHRDSDGNGTGDGAEDDDHDGRSNAREQDNRPVPRGLRPTLARAPTAFPPARAECQTAHRSAAIHPCAFGDTGSDTTIAIFGDSHATQWQPALDRAGAREGWRIVMLTKTGCPSVDVMPGEQIVIDGGVTCGLWRHRALRWLRDHSPDVVIVSNLGLYLASEPDWQEGLERTLSALPRRSTSVVLDDTPNLRNEPAPCLQAHRHHISACVTPRARTENAAHEQAERAAARREGAMFVSLDRKVCSYDPCPLIIGNTMLWRDHGHITPRFSRQLAPSIADKVSLALAEGAAQGRPDGRIR